MMGLPKGSLKGLARVVSPLCFWMAAGWAAYPHVIKIISDKMGETVAMNEVEPFSMFMVAACIASGIILAAYGFIGREPSDAEIVALAVADPLCPYCGKPLQKDAVQCPECGKKMLE